MATRSNASTLYSSATTSYQFGSSRQPTNNGRPRSARPRTATSTIAGDQQIICAVSESRGISPVIGLAFVNLSTAESCLCQISDNQTFSKTLQKLQVYDPSEILVMTTAADPNSRLVSLVEVNLNTRITYVERKYWSETAGMDYIQQLAFKEDLESIKLAVDGNYYTICCFAAALRYIEVSLFVSFSFHSLRIKYESSEGSMMIDLATIHSLELIQNLQNPKSKDCLYGFLNQTLTPMGARKLKSTILQPSTDQDVIEKRYAALTELTAKEDVFFAVRQALRSFVDTDRVLTAISIIPARPTIHYSQQSINNVIMLKQFVRSIHPIYEALSNVQSDLLKAIAGKCAPDQTFDLQRFIAETINEDITYQKQPLDLRNQRVYAVKSGVNGLLDVARQTYKESNADAYQLITDLGTEHNLALNLKYDSARQYYIRLAVSELQDRNLPPVFINVFRKKNIIECQTLDLLKWNQKIIDSHHEVIQMSDQSIQSLIVTIRENIAPLFKISEAIALLDMMVSFAQIVTTQNYVCPEITPTLAIKSGRHPIREKIHGDKYVPNDVYATQQSRFQIITGCNMSGKSSYIRSIALMSVMAQLGSFVPATYASCPIRHQMFARVSTDDSIEANVSTFAAEMRETAFILRNIDSHSLVIIDELGRGTSTRDGLCIAIAVAEALVDSGACVWFVTHFRDLPRILAERSGVISLHLQVDMIHPNPDLVADHATVTSAMTTMKMLYTIAPGPLNGQSFQSHYGLALARIIGLPQNVIDTATDVCTVLDNIATHRRRGHAAQRILLNRRRKLILELREQLVQARQGNLRGEDLRVWLKELQDRFVQEMAMADVDAESGSMEMDSSSAVVTQLATGGQDQDQDQDQDQNDHAGIISEAGDEGMENVRQAAKSIPPPISISIANPKNHRSPTPLNSTDTNSSPGWCVHNASPTTVAKAKAAATSGRYEMSGAQQTP